VSQHRWIPLLAAAAATAGLIAACEGEPPKIPQNAAPEPSASPTVNVVESEVGEKLAPTLPPPAEAPKPCTPCAPAAGDAGAPAVAQADGGAPAPAAVTHANITGHVTTQPPKLAPHAVVWLDDAPKDPTRGMVARIDNRGMTYAPFVQVVAAGGKVSFGNSDPFPHNVFSPDNEKFNMGQIAPRQARSHVFDKPGTYSLLCNLHPNMLGYLVVTPSSYFAKADAKGHFTIKDVPAGTYQITAWAPRQKTVTQPVTIKDGDASVSFELHR